MKLFVWQTVVVALFMGGVSCSRAPKQATEKSSLEPIVGSVDVPPVNGTLKIGAVGIGGWALAESGVQRVAIYIDRQFVGFATMGGSRPDILRAFNSFPNAITSGWNAIIDTSPFPPGEHLLVMQIESKAGNVHDFPPVRFKTQ